MSKTLVLMLGVGLWMVGASQAADKPDTLAMPRPVAGVEPAGEPAAAHTPGVAPSGDIAAHGGHCRNCLGRFVDWLCYRAPEPPVKCACCNGRPCCHPQLHTYFLHRCGACAADDEPGIPITFSYTDLMERNGDEHCGHGGCGCRGCK